MENTAVPSTPERVSTVLRCVSAALAGAGICRILLWIFCSVTFIHPLRYTVTADRGLPYFSGAILLFIPMLLKKDGFSGSLKLISAASYPAVLLLLLPLDTMWGMLTGIFLLGWIFFRWGTLAEIKLPALPPAWGIAVITVLTAAFAVWGYYIQQTAYDSLFLIYGDWNQYAAHYQLLNSGDFRWIDLFAGAGHWNFGVNMLMAGLFKLHCGAETVFAVNALVVASIIPLLYTLARKLKLSVWNGIFIALAAIFNPVISNQFLSHFYGFHPIVFFIPLVIGFFICKVIKCRWGMVTLFLLSLTVQETVAVFWGGYALYLICSKRWKTGGILLPVMIGWFFFLSNTVIPLSSRTENYAQMFHFAQLGDTPLQALFSPVLRPAAFWGTLFEPASCYFMICLFLPLFFALILNGKLLLSILPILAGVCLQNSPDVKTVILQYGLEITVITLICALFNWKYASSRRNLAGRLCAAGLPQPGNFRTASVSGVFCTAVLCSVLLGFFPWSKGWNRNIMAFENGGELLKHLNEAIKVSGGAKRVVATGRLRGQFQFSLPNAAVGDELQSGDVIIIDLHDGEVEGETAIAAVRQKILRDNTIIPVTFVEWQNRTIVVFKKMDAPQKKKPLPFLTRVPENLSLNGISIPHPEKAIDIRYSYHSNANHYMVMLKENINFDLELQLRFQDAANQITATHAVLFAHGLIPAYALPARSCFYFSIPGNKPARQEFSLIRRQP